MWLLVVVGLFFFSGIWSHLKGRGCEGRELPRRQLGAIRKQKQWPCLLTYHGDGSARETRVWKCWLGSELCGWGVGSQQSQRYHERLGANRDFADVWGLGSAPFGRQSEAQRSPVVLGVGACPYQDGAALWLALGVCPLVLLLLLAAHTNCCSIRSAAFTTSASCR